MKIYIHDRTFKGFLTAAALALKDAAGTAEIAATPGTIPDLFAEIIETGTDNAEAGRLMTLIESTGAADSGQTVRFAFLSEVAGAETAVLKYIRLLLEKGSAADDMLADERVKKVHELAGKTGGEAHMFKGLTRFRELADKTLYAKIEPDHNILPLVAHHFRARLAPFNWVLHDTGRGTAAFYYEGRLAYAPITPSQALELDGKEDAVQSLWKHFFKAAAIKERLNPGLQRRFVPLKYRKHLTEFE